MIQISNIPSEIQRDGVLMLKGVRATGELRGLMLEMCVEQQYINRSLRNREVVYTFPLPWRAVLLDVEARLGARQLTSKVYTKSGARYEEAISNGDVTILVTQNRDYSYTLNLGNLKGKEKCNIRLRYVQKLQIEHDGLRLLIPTVIAPRYGDGVRDGRLEPHQVPDHDLLTEYPFNISLRLHGELAHGEVTSPSHAINTVLESVGASDALTVSLVTPAALDRDFILNLTNLSHSSRAIWARDCVKQDETAVLASFRPTIATEKNDISVKILVDCSNSMAGDSINTAKTLLKAILKKLDSTDSLSLSRFGNSVEHLSNNLGAPTELTRIKAGRWIEGLKADLGYARTESALYSVYALVQPISSDVLILTDGNIEAIEATIASAKSARQRVFVIGLGSSASETHLRRLAEETLGACDFVSPGESLESVVSRMLERLRMPRITKLMILWPGAEKTVTPLSNAVFDKDTIHAFALLKHKPEGVARLIGTYSSQTTPQEIGWASFSEEAEPGDALPRMVASLRLHLSANNSLNESGVSMASLAMTIDC